MNEQRRTIKLAGQKTLVVTIARELYFQNESMQGEGFYYAFDVYTPDDESAAARLNASPELADAMVAVQPCVGDTLVITNQGSNNAGPWKVIRQKGPGGKMIQQYTKGGPKAANGNGNGNSNGNGSSNGNGNGNTNGNGERTMADMVGIFVECLAAAAKVMEHPVTKYIFYKKGYSDLAPKELLDIAMHFSIERFRNRATGPLDESYSYPPPEGRWDNIIAKMDGVEK